MKSHHNVRELTRAVHSNIDEFQKHQQKMNSGPRVDTVFYLLKFQKIGQLLDELDVCVVVLALGEA